MDIHLITLCNNNRKKTFNIHTIVASHFIIKPHGTFVVNHKNEDKIDNRLENLEWIVRKNQKQIANDYILNQQENPD